jgi:hypothetical protein
VWIADFDINYDPEMMSNAESIANGSKPCSSNNAQRLYDGISIEDLENLVSSRIPENTQRKVDWSMRLFSSWLCYWRVKIEGPPKVLKNIEEFTDEELDYCLQFFFAEVRKKDGKRYPPATIKEIGACIQNHFVNKFNRNWSIFKDTVFSRTRKVLDAVMKASAKDGNVRPKKRAAPITLSHENEMWSNGTFGRSSGKQLLSTLIYHIGLHFALRACKEHRDLMYGEGSQITLEVDKVTNKERLKYVERTSKNKKFGLKQCRMEPKITFAYENVDKQRCIVQLYKDYISHRPEAHDKPGHSAFYLTPIPNPKGTLWFKNIPVGINTISSNLKKIMSSNDDGNFYSNTSLRRTAKTRLTESGISRDLTMKKTGLCLLTKRF